MWTNRSAFARMTKWKVAHALIEVRALLSLTLFLECPEPMYFDFAVDQCQCSDSSDEYQEPTYGHGIGTCEQSKIFIFMLIVE
jgi:hypothetical protein